MQGPHAFACSWLYHLGHDLSLKVGLVFNIIYYLLLEHRAYAERSAIQGAMQGAREACVCRAGRHGRNAEHTHTALVLTAYSLLLVS